MDNNYLQDLFIDDVKGLLNRNGSGFVDPDDPTIILVDEDGNELTAVLVDEEVVLDATANDIREGKVAATDDGVTVGTKEIPSYITTEGITAVPAGKELFIKLRSNVCDYTKMQAIICAFNTELSNSVAAEKVLIGESVYPVNSTESLSTVNKAIENERVNFGISNDADKPRVIRYITYKEEY